VPDILDAAEDFVRCKKPGRPPRPANSRLRLHHGATAPKS